MKNLIVNADDFNTDRERNRGILEAARCGIVTSTTVLAGLPWHEQDREQLLRVFQGRGIGVHLNVTRGQPLAAGSRTLARPDGNFFTKPEAWRRALRRSYDSFEAEREFSAQIESLCGQGFAPDHIDGNNHLHVFPGLSAAAARSARRFGIKAVRLPQEPLWWSAGKPAAGFLKKCFICVLCLRAAGVFRQAGLIWPERCAGVQVPAAGSEKELSEFLLRLPGGTTELMCHPGYPSADNSFSTSERLRELGALTSPHIRDMVEQHAIRLIDYGQLLCA